MKPATMQALYMLPIDHRDDFVHDMFQVEFPLTDIQHQHVMASKQLVYDGFLASLGTNEKRSHCGIVIDEQFGAKILIDAQKRQLISAVSVEKSTGHEFEFEYGRDFATHIESFKPTFANAVLRYNTEGDAELNRRQAIKLAELSEYCKKNGQTWMIELLVPPTKSQLSWYHADIDIYHRKCRPELTVQAICELQDAGVEPDVWTVEGLDNRASCVDIVEAAQRNGRDKTVCLVDGYGSGEKKIADCLTIAGSVPGYIGFALGRTTFVDVIREFNSNKIVRQVAVSRIAQRYRMWINIFEQAHSDSVAVPIACTF